MTPCRRSETSSSSRNPDGACGSAGSASTIGSGASATAGATAAGAGASAGEDAATATAGTGAVSGAGAKRRFGGTARTAGTAGIGPFGGDGAGDRGSYGEREGRERPRGGGVEAVVRQRRDASGRERENDASESERSRGPRAGTRVWRARRLRKEPRDAAKQLAAVGGEGHRAGPPGIAALLEVDERARIDDRVAGGGDGEIVAAILPLDADPAGDPPDGRVVEEQGLSRALDQVDEVVVAADVRELVREQRLDLFDGHTGERRNREEHRRPENSEGDGDL